MQGEIEKHDLGAPDHVKERMEQEEKIRNAIESEFPSMTEAAKAAIIESRLKILELPDRPTLIKGDLGENARQHVKDKLFE